MPLPVIVRPDLSSPRRRAQALFYSGKLLNQIAHNTAFAGLVFLAGGSSHAAVGLSGLFMAAVLPPLLIGIPAGAAVDRMGHGRGLILGAALRTVALAVAVAAVSDERSGWVLALALSASGVFYAPASLALVRTLQAETAGAAHASLATLQYGGQGIGLFLLAPALYWAGGVPAIFGGASVLSAGVILISWMVARRVQLLPVERAERAGAVGVGAVARTMVANSQARYAIAVSACKVVVSRGIVVILPLYLTHDLHAGRSAIGALMVPGVAGAVAGLLSASRIVTPARAAGVMRAALIGMALSVMALAFLDNGIDVAARYSHLPPLKSFDDWANTTYAVALPVAFVLGFVMSTSLVSTRVALTSAAPRSQQARVFAIQETVTEALLVLPVLGFAALAEMAGARLTLTCLGVLAAAVFVVLEAWEARHEVSPLGAVEGETAAA